MLDFLKKLNNKEGLTLNLEELEYLKLFIKLNVNDNLIDYFCENSKK